MRKISLGCERNDVVWFKKGNFMFSMQLAAFAYSQLNVAGESDAKNLFFEGHII